MFRLSTTQRQVLLHCQLAADRTVKEIAQRAKRTPASVRRVIDTLTAKRLITKRVFINLPGLGYSTFQVLLALAPREMRIAAELEKWFKHYPLLIDANRIGGDHHYGVILLGRTIEEVGLFLDSLSSTFGPIVVQKEIATVRSLTLFGSKWLIPGSIPQPALSYGAHPIIDHDNIDLALLSQMASGLSKSLTAAARTLQIPVSSAIYRWHRARTSKIIAGEFYELASGSFGMNTYLFLVSCNNATPQFYSSFLKFAEAHRNIDVVTQTIGSWDYALHIQVEHHADAAQLSLELYTQFPRYVSHIRVIPFFYNVTFSPFPVRTPMSAHPA